MVIDRNLLEEYPYDGVFYTYSIDETKPLEEQTEEEILVAEVKCDIQESSKSDAGGNISASFNIYFPLEGNEDIRIQRGMSFRGSVCGMEVNGKVIGFVPTQMGYACYITDVDV